MVSGKSTFHFDISQGAFQVWWVLFCSWLVWRCFVEHKVTPVGLGFFVILCNPRPFGRGYENAARWALFHCRVINPTTWRSGLWLCRPLCCDLWFRFLTPRPDGRGYESAALRALFGLVPVREDHNHCFYFYHYFFIHDFLYMYPSIRAKKHVWFNFLYFPSSYL